jgi:hypothetical protein
MFLIECGKGCFVDGEDIQWVRVKESEVLFILKSDSQTQMKVDSEFQSSFVNNLQAINDNIASVESAYHKIQPDFTNK